jgi:hypothetical protein
MERRKHSRNIDIEDLVHQVYIGNEHSCSVCCSVCVLPKLTAYAAEKGGACTCTRIVDESASFPVLSLARLQCFRSLPHPTKQSQTRSLQRLNFVQFLEQLQGRATHLSDIFQPVESIPPARQLVINTNFFV